MKPHVLSLCDRSGVMVRPWAEAGYACVCVDIEGTETIERFPSGGMIIYGRGDVYQFRVDGPVGIAFGFPPCTDLAVSGARHFAAKGLKRCIDALRLVDRVRELLEGTGAPWMLENPVGRLSTCWRKPDVIFNPCDYGGYLSPPGDAYTKKTCLWTGNGFRIPDPRPVDPVEGSRIYNMPDSAGRQVRRSITPAGFAMAVYHANKEHVK